MTCYAAPATEPLVLHVVAVPTVPGADGEPVDVPDAVTACCGRVMDPGDLWTVVEAQPGDRVCPGAPAQEGIF